MGAEILAQGGSATDAAVATALALGVVSPASSGLGGGGFALVYVARERKVYVLDFREVGPAAITPDLFRDKGVVVPERSRTGGLAVGVPGEAAGLGRLWQRSGRLTWSELVEPARELADDGFIVSWFTGMAAGEIADGAGAAETTPFGHWLRPAGRLVSSGRRVRRSALARTLAHMSRNGADSFYRDWIARDVVATAQAAGGVLTLEDLTRYQVIEREPLWGRFGRYRLATMPLPSSGGLVVLEALGLLEATGQDLTALGPQSSASQHLIAEVLKHAFADRARHLGSVDASAGADQLLDPARLRKLAGRISMKRTAPSKSYGSAELPAARATAPDDRGTSHLCVIDRDGNAVALTTTINGYYGAHLVGADTGVVLNNQIDDFSLASGVANQFGLVQSDANLVAPGKRPLSSMSPTLVFDGDRVIACAGGSGGPRIISATFQVLVNLLIHRMDAGAAVAADRVHHQWTPDTLFVEKATPSDVVAGLEKRGHKTEVLKKEGVVQLVVVHDGVREAASDPRKGGDPAAEDQL